MNTNQLTNLGLATGSTTIGAFENAPTLIGLEVPELPQGTTDLNGDGDLLHLIEIP